MSSRSSRRRWLATALVGIYVGCLAPALRAEGPDGELFTADPSAVVVRVWTRDPGLLAELAHTVDLWAYRPHEGYAEALLTAVEYQELSARGLRLEIDWERTERFHAEPAQVPEVPLAGIPGFSCYRTVEETYSSLAGLATAHPTLARWIDLGDSWEKLHGPGAGYDVQALVIGNQDVSGPKYPFVLMAAMHARELATAELATRFAEELINGYGVNADATWILDHAEITVIPQLNPDGRKRAEAGAFWRKNVNNSYCANSSSRGIDLNRNSSFFWGESGSSGSQCAEDYRGPGASSEPETQAVESYLAQVFDDQRGPALTDPAPATTTGLFISLHSYGELVLFSWEGRENTPPPNNAALATLARKFGYLNQYYACQTGLYDASGTTVDHAYGIYGVAAYTFEVGNDFFESCSAFQSSVLNVNLAALRYAAKAARRPYQDPSGPEVLAVALSAASVAAGQPVTLTATADDTRYDSNGCGTEPTQGVASASYTIDVPPWDAGSGTPLAATDGSFSSGVEALNGTVDTASLASGRHLIYVTATDSAGNRGVPSAVFLDITTSNAIFADGFESGDTAAWSVTVGGL